MAVLFCFPVPSMRRTTTTVGNRRLRLRPQERRVQPRVHRATRPTASCSSHASTCPSLQRRDFSTSRPRECTTSRPMRTESRVDVQGGRRARPPLEGVPHGRFGRRRVCLRARRCVLSCNWRCVSTNLRETAVRISTPEKTLVHDVGAGHEGAQFCPFRRPGVR